MTVDSYIQRMFGADAKNFADSKVLLVGAGGIGCELLKDLIMMNIGEIHVLDLDTIDLSNLNRQFLFRHKDIKQSKSKTAIKAVEFFTYKSKLYSYHGSILDKKMFPLSFFKQFNVIYNALDNLEARFYVNRICLYLNIPLYESGTTGLKGQVQPIYPYLTECFHCLPKETPKTFPVCTIRSTPSKPVHCITWAKDFLFSQLFVDDDNTEISKTDASEFTNEEEAEASTNEVNELADLKKLIYNSKFEDFEFVKTIFEKIFINDIERLLKIDELWKSREKPSFNKISNYSIILNSINDITLNRSYTKTSPNQESIDDIIKTFATSLLILSDRVRNKEQIEFDKDDNDTLKFVMSTANLRSLIFHIPTKSEFDVKQIAGNIIPAVATMNAIMAGFSALSSVNFYIQNNNLNRVTNSRMVFDSSSTDKVVNSSKLIKPNSHCSACSVVKGILEMDLNNFKLSDLRNALLEKYDYQDDVEIMTLDSRLLYDYDIEENLEKPINTFIEDETILLINDSDETLDIIELYVINTPNSEIKLPDLSIPLKISGKAESEEDISANGNAEASKASEHIILDEDDDLIMEQPPSKKRKIA
jgi:ubiquitin-like 1-activating enzyme E1 B